LPVATTHEHTSPSIKIGSLFCLFCLFVMVRSLGPCIPRLCAWYHRKALGKEGCTGFVSWHSDLRWKSYGFSKFSKNKKTRKLLLFTFCLRQQHTGILVFFERILWSNFGFKIHKTLGVHRILHGALFIHIYWKWCRYIFTIKHYECYQYKTFMKYVTKFAIFQKCALVYGLKRKHCGFLFQPCHS